MCPFPGLNVFGGEEVGNIIEVVVSLVWLEPMSNYNDVINII